MSDDVRILPYLFEYFNVLKYFKYFFITAVLISGAAFIDPRVFRRRFPFVTCRGILILSLFLCVILRVAWIGFSVHEVKTSWQPEMSEMDLIHNYAVDITKGVFFQNPDGAYSARRPIAYPIFLSVFYKIFGSGLHVLWTIQVVLSLLTTVIIYRLGRRVFNERVGALASLYFAVYPIAVMSVKTPQDEHLFMPLVYGGLLMLVWETQTSIKRWSWAVYGLIFGYAAMAKTHAIALPVVLACTYLYAGVPKKKILVNVIGIVLVMQAVNLPWVIRNYRIWKVPVFYTTSGGFLYAQLNPSARGYGRGHIPQRGEDGFSEEVEAAAKTGNTGLIHGACMRAAARWCLENPLQCLILGIEKELEFMGIGHRGVWPLWHQYYEGCYDKSRPLSEMEFRFLNFVSCMGYFFLFYTFVFGAVLTIRRFGRLPQSSRVGIIAVASFIILYLMGHFFVFAVRKYRFSIEPLMMIFSCTFLDYLYTEFDIRRFVKKIVPTSFPQG